MEGRARQRFTSKTKGVFDLVGTVIVGIGIIGCFIIAIAFGSDVNNIGYSIAISLSILVSGIVLGAVFIATAEILTALEKICNNLAELAEEKDVAPNDDTNIN